MMIKIKIVMIVIIVLIVIFVIFGMTIILGTQRHAMIGLNEVKNDEKEVYDISWKYIY